jgi:hypothetical protein
MYRLKEALLLIDIVVEWQRSHSRTSGGRTSLVSASNDDAARKVIWEQVRDRYNMPPNAPPWIERMTSCSLCSIASRSTTTTAGLSPTAPAIMV